MEIVFDSEMKMYSVKDLGSQNGTFVNKVRLSEPKHESELQPLSHGDILTVSSTSLMLHIHCGSETCDECEPGEIQARLQNETVGQSSQTGILDKEQQRRQELNKLKKRYLLRRKDDVEFVDALPYSVDGQYEDRAAKRRVEVGSDVPVAERSDQSASVHRPIDVSNKGRQMLEKMGWAEGQGLGATNMGIAEPVQAVVRSQRSGLGTGVKRSIGDGNSKTLRSNENWDKARERFARMT
jgi:hypothetical protein